MSLVLQRHQSGQVLLSACCAPALGRHGARWGGMVKGHLDAPTTAFSLFSKLWLRNYGTFHHPAGVRLARDRRAIGVEMSLEIGTVHGPRCAVRKPPVKLPWPGYQSATRAAVERLTIAGVSSYCMFYTRFSRFSEADDVHPLCNLCKAIFRISIWAARL
jgi:hypothetical protein